MKNAEEIKQEVRNKYAAIVQPQVAQSPDSCCGSSCEGEEYSSFSDDYSQLAGYQPDADLGLGCGLPTEYARMKEKDTVVDLGSGAGNDCFVARSVVGDTGQVIGVDMTPAMVDKARQNARKLGYKNVEFRYGEIEDLPLEDHVADVVVSNCVLNLVPDKERAFRETYRILKPGGHFSISDVVIRGDLPETLQASAELYAGCISGALAQEDYLRTVREAGFQHVRIQQEKCITLTDELLSEYLPPEEIEQFRKSKVGIYSITVYAEKPL